jgi:hypothetical protein
MNSKPIKRMRDFISAFINVVFWHFSLFNPFDITYKKQRAFGIWKSKRLIVSIFFSSPFGLNLMFLASLNIGFTIVPSSRIEKYPLLCLIFLTC